jgi:hypothetical protein
VFFEDLMKIPEQLEEHEEPWPEEPWPEEPKHEEPSHNDNLGFLCKTTPAPCVPPYYALVYPGDFFPWVSCPVAPYITTYRPVTAYDVWYHRTYYPASGPPATLPPTIPRRELGELTNEKEEEQK